MWVTLRVVDCDVNGHQVGDTGKNHANVVYHDFSVFITLKKQELASSSVIVCVDSRDRDYFVNSLILEHDDALLMARMWLEGRRRTNYPDVNSAIGV